MTVIRDVTLRDGLQLPGKILPIKEKITLARELLRAGAPSSRSAQMAGTLEVIEALSKAEREHCWV